MYTCTIVSSYQIYSQFPPIVLAWFWLLSTIFSQNNMFDEYRLEGKDDRNEIYLEVNLDQLNRALKSTLNAQAVKIKLTKKQGACLTIDITQVYIYMTDTCTGTYAKYIKKLCF